jgi:uncharacterized membrane protein YccF (DUF307 family)
MPLLHFLLNVLWIVTGGAWMAAAWPPGAVIMAVTIVGLAWTRAAFNIAVYTLLPFGRRAVSAPNTWAAWTTGLARSVFSPISSGWC